MGEYRKNTKKGTLPFCIFLPTVISLHITSNSPILAHILMSSGFPLDYHRRLVMAAAAAASSGQGQGIIWPQQHPPSDSGSGQAPSSYEATVKAYLEKYPSANANGEDTRRRRDDDGNDEESRSRRRMVLWRGNYVSEAEAKALRHVFDDMNDHFGHNLPDPDVSVVLTGLSHLGGGRDTIWEGELDFI